MQARMVIKVLAENGAAAVGVRGEHGLAFWLETGDARLLFDTGQGLVLEENARVMGVDLGSIVTVALSHGHYDHTGGLATMLRQATGPVRVYAHPDVCLARYRYGAGPARAIGMPAGAREALRANGCRWIEVRGPTEIAPGIWLTGPVPRVHTEEASNEPFSLDEAGREPDPLTDDQALFVRTARGTVVLLGCAHAGAVNTLDHILKLTEGHPIRAVVGGMHMGSATDARIEWTVRELRRFGLDLLAPMHCTGPKAAAALWTAFQDACRPCGAGTTLEL